MKSNKQKIETIKIYKRNYSKNQIISLLKRSDYGEANYPENVRKSLILTLKEYDNV